MAPSLKSKLAKLASDPRPWTFNKDQTPPKYGWRKVEDNGPDTFRCVFWDEHFVGDIVAVEHSTDYAVLVNVRRQGAQVRCLVAWLYKKEDETSPLIKVGTICTLFVRSLTLSTAGVALKYTIHCLQPLPAARAVRLVQACGARPSHNQRDYCYRLRQRCEPSYSAD
jgi:hypothetical protein